MTGWDLPDPSAPPLRGWTDDESERMDATVRALRAADQKARRGRPVLTGAERDKVMSHATRPEPRSKPGPKPRVPEPKRTESGRWFIRVRKKQQTFDTPQEAILWRDARLRELKFKEASNG